MRNWMKKILGLTLTMMLALGAIGPAWAESATEAEAPAAEEIEYPDELRVGNPTVMKGDFFTEMFGNDTADIDVRALIHGYNLVSWDQAQGVYLIDESVVESTLVAEDEIGNRTYFFGLYDDLSYSDGTPITAWDYAFSILLMMSKEIEEIGGKIYRSEHILGSGDYLTGKTPYLTGVGVIDDHQLAITLDHNFLPYFFETGLFLCVPYPISEIAPGCRVYAGQASDLGNGYGYGIRIGNEDESVTEPIYTAELLAKTILDPETGYNSHPKVSSGPYVLTEYDGTTARFELNKYYKGAWLFNTLPEDFQFDIQKLDGAGSGRIVNSHTGPNIVQVDRVDAEGNENPMYLIVPTIEKISFTVADNDKMLQDLEEGTFHLINKVSYGPTIQAILGTGATGAAAEAEAAEDGETGTAEEAGTEAPEGEEALPETEEAEAEAEATEEEAEAEETEEETEAEAEETEEAEAETEEEAEAAAEEESGLRFQNYPRVGLSFLTFSYDWPTVHEKEVRQALAWCMDREAMTEEYTQGMGIVVNGYYGMEQWEYLICTDQLEYPVNLMEDETHTDEDLEEWAKHANMYATTEKEYEEMLAAWEMLSLDNLVNYNVYDLENDPERTKKTGIDKAKALLNEAGWTLNRSGEKYDPAKDDVRCKMIDGELTALDLKMMYPEGNHMAEIMEEHFLENAKEAGILITPVPEKMEELLKSYYREKERTTDMIYLATNFHVVVDPSITYSTDPTPDHLLWNNTYSDDEDLWYRAVNMRQTDPRDVYDYVTKWISFQERYNEVLPCIPIYSNIYFDFWMNQLQNYVITEHVTWSQAILESYFGEPPEEEAPAEGEEGEAAEEDDTLF